MAWRLTGHARMARIMESGREQRLTLVGGVLSIVMLWQGFILLPGGQSAAAPFTTIMSELLPLHVWAVLVFAVGAVQFGGYTLAYLGLMLPLRRPRIIVAGIVVGYFVMIATALGLSGYVFGSANALALALLGARDLANADSVD